MISVMEEYVLWVAEALYITLFGVVIIGVRVCGSHLHRVNPNSICGVVVEYMRSFIKVGPSNTEEINDDGQKATKKKK